MVVGICQYNNQLYLEFELKSPAIKSKQGSKFDQWAVHENRFLFSTAVKLATVYIRSFNRRLHFLTTFGVPENIDYRGRCRLRRYGRKNIRKNLRIDL